MVVLMPEVIVVLVVVLVVVADVPPCDPDPAFVEVSDSEPLRSTHAPSSLQTRSPAHAPSSQRHPAIPGVQLCRTHTPGSRHSSPASQDSPARQAQPGPPAGQSSVAGLLSVKHAANAPNPIAIARPNRRIDPGAYHLGLDLGEVPRPIAQPSDHDGQAVPDANSTHDCARHDARIVVCLAPLRLG